jgi:hypothetical protein
VSSSIRTPVANSPSSDGAHRVPNTHHAASSLTRQTYNYTRNLAAHLSSPPSPVIPTEVSSDLAIHSANHPDLTCHPESRRPSRRVRDPLFLFDIHPALSFRPKWADAFSSASLREAVGPRSGGISLRSTRASQCTSPTDLGNHQIHLPKACHPEPAAFPGG